MARGGARPGAGRPARKSANTSPVSARAREAMVAAGWTEAQKRAYVLADHQLAITGSIRCRRRAIYGCWARR